MPELIIDRADFRLAFQTGKRRLDQREFDVADPKASRIFANPVEGGSAVAVVFSGSTQVVLLDSECKVRLVNEFSLDRADHDS